MAADKTFLRPLTEADIDTIYSLTSDPRVAKYMRFSTHTSRKEARSFFMNIPNPAIPAGLSV